MCDGHAHGSSVGWVYWATVCLVVIVDVDVHALHRSCLRHISIFSIMAGSCVMSTVRRGRMASFM